VSDYCLAPTQQYFSHIMARTSYFSMWNENGFIDILHHFSLLYYLSFNSHLDKDKKKCCVFNTCSGL